MQKIVFVNRFYRPDFSATSQMLTDLAEALVQRGYRVQVVTTRQLYEDSSASLPGRELIAGVDIVRVWTTRFGRHTLWGRALDYVSCYLTMFLHLAVSLRRGDCVVAKTDPPLISVVVALAAAARQSAHVNWLQDVFPEVALRTHAARHFAWMGRPLTRMRDWSLRKAKFNVAIGPRMREYLAARAPAPCLWYVVPNWADGNAIRPRQATVSTLRRSLNLEEFFVVGYSGNLGQAHDHAAILQAAKQLRDHARIRFLMVGGGAGMKILQRQAQESGLPNMVFVGYQPRESLCDSLSAIDLHLVSLLPEYEGLIVPSKIYGVLAAGRPMVFIGAESGELAEELKKYGIGSTVRCRDGRALAEAVERFAVHGQFCRDAGVRARQVFDSRYSMQEAVTAWDGALRSYKQPSVNSERTQEVQS